VNSLSQCGDHLVSGSWDTTAKVWDLQTRTCIKTLGGHSHSVAVLFVNPSIIIMASIDKNIYFWKNGEKTKTISGAHSDGIRHLELDKNLGFLSASNDEAAKLWTLTGEALHTFQGNESYVYWYSQK
jgi:WD40 repeat protein